MVGKLSLGKISIGIVLIAITENSNNPVKSTIMVMGLFKAARTIIDYLIV
jgi:hypothetical protein